MPDAEPVHKAFERWCLLSRYGIYELLRRNIGEPIKLQQLVFGKAVYICQVCHVPRIYQSNDVLLAQRVDIERALGGKMFEAPLRGRVELEPLTR